MGPVAVCAIFKDEAPNLLEWIAYHLSVGFDHFVLYDNGSTDGGAARVTNSAFQSVVHVINWPERPAQLTAYQDFCNRFARNFVWVAFIDIDEFVHPLSHNSIKHVLPHYADASGVLLHWMMFGPSGHVARPLGLVIDAYTIRLPLDHERCRWVKSLLRTADILGLTDSPHVFDMRGIQVNARGEIVDPSSQLPPCHDIIVLNHYFTKSREDWDTKRKRGYTFALTPGDQYGIEELEEIDLAATEHDMRIRRFVDPVKRVLASGPPDTLMPVNLAEIFLQRQDQLPSFRINSGFASDPGAVGPRMGKAISILSCGAFANRMIQYMAAVALCDRIPGSFITGVKLPEWHIPHIENPGPELFEQTVALSESSMPATNFRELSEIVNKTASINIVISDYMQRLDLLALPSRYMDIFPKSATVAIGNDELLIHIRAGDILVGVSHYPLIPAAYYRWLAQISGLRPVFCGQLSDSPYILSIRRAFPDARFIEPTTPLEDFQMIRSARHIATSVSTFSWLAAWLSDAETIFLPLCGFLSPVTMPEIDLLPTADPRYRFIQFPHFFGIEESAMLEHHDRLANTWQEISPRQVALLRDTAPFLAPRTDDTPFEPVWYTHTYLDAAKEISLGWFRDPLHHYLEVGRLRGHYPTRAASRLALGPLPGRNLALRGLASQSSVSVWSQMATIEADAAIALNGRVWEDKFFHTDSDPNPWWSVDLREICHVSRIRIFNRDGPEIIRRRASPLLAEASIDGEDWYPLFQTGPGQVFGGRNGNPFLWTAAVPVQARFVKITLQRQEFFHLAEVEVYGRSLGT